MSRGATDFGATAALPLLAAALDPGELAVRLGSPVVFDRIGNVVYWSLGDEVRWPLRETANGDGRVDVLAGRGLYGGYGLRLRAGTTQGNETTWRTLLPRVLSGAVGLEMVWWSDAGIDVVTVEFLDVSSGARLRPALRVDYTDDETQHRNSAGTFVATPTQPDVVGTDGRWQQIKLVVDVTAATYVRAVMDGQDLGLDAVAVQDSGSGSAEVELRVVVRMDSAGAQTREVIVGALIFTVNEPT